MTLASADGAGGGGKGGPDLKADQAPWASAGGVAGALRTATALTELETSGEGVAGGTEGFTATAAVTEVRTGWKDRLTSVRDECARLEGALRSAGKDFGERETATRQKIKAAMPQQPKNRG
ncbi:hypothetical protein NLX86_31675 [Streptomyces sp. A3M-1-3]|uniref:hypothetical protein n=1 Tax=Streptomyces sp. A3M-1-3 TaxID=2962044 RepID=UPI0020B6ECE4|nr:hypothetical protein [Streptomyces sp. A3M-1-3]MCP3822483.1 hypothetical protein [Streptomyces sp. A3M-1-3]